MPNWCDCEMVIHGKTEDVHRLKEAVKDGDEVLSANKIISYPEDFAILDKFHSWEDPFVADLRKAAEMPQDLKTALEAKGYDLNKGGFNQGGYEWCIQNWGTKWGFRDSEVVSEVDYQSETTLEYHFETAWSPPKPLIKKLGEMFPMLEIELRYFEAGMGFNGLFRMKDGQIETNEEGKYFGHRGG